MTAHQQAQNDNGEIWAKIGQNWQKSAMRAGAHRCARGLIFQHLIGIEVSWGLPLKPIRLNQLLLSNLLKTDFPLKLTIHKCQRKQQCIVEPRENDNGTTNPELNCPPN